MVGANIWIAKSQLPKADVDEYYWSDLKGLTVLGLDDDEQEVNLGQIHELFETGANDVMVVRATPDSIDSEERMIRGIKMWCNALILKLVAFTSMGRRLLILL